MVEAEIGAYIVASVAGLSFTPTLGTTVFMGRRMPTSPDAVVALVEYAGPRGEYTHTSGGALAWERPHVQVTVRGKQAAGGYSDARANAEKLYQQLAQIHNQTLSGTFYLGVTCMQSPFELGPDAQDRPYYGFNIECWKYLSVN